MLLRTLLLTLTVTVHLISYMLCLLLILMMAAEWLWLPAVPWLTVARTLLNLLIFFILVN